jgi:hypothetical protein
MTMVPLLVDARLKVVLDLAKEISLLTCPEEAASVTATRVCREPLRGPNS